MLLAILQGLLLAAYFLVIAILVARLAFPPAKNGALSEVLRAQTAQHEGLTGIAALEDGMDAFVARMLLAGAATSSIDVQYYIWRADMTGYVLLKALLRAADRGVRCCYPRDIQFDCCSFSLSAS